MIEERTTCTSKGLAMMAASIPAVWAHAGRVHVGDAVEVVCTSTWAAIRGDIAPLVAGTAAVEASKDRVPALRRIAPLWAGRTPAWAAPR